MGCHEASRHYGLRHSITHSTKRGRRTMERNIYDEDHEAFRDVVKEFVKRYATEE